MRPHHQVHTPAAQAVHSPLAVSGRGEAREKRRLDREALKPPQNRLIVLEGQDRSRDKDGTLLAVGNALERGAQGDLRLAKANIPAQQAVHGMRLLHILFDLLNAAELVIRLLVLKPALKVALHLRIGGEGISRRAHPLGIQGRELLGHILDRGPHTAARLGPVRAAQAVELDCLDAAVLPRRDVLGHQVELGDRHIENIVFQIADLDIVLCHTADIQLVNPLKNADTVDIVDNVVPPVQLFQRVNSVFSLHPGAGFPPGGGRPGISGDGKMDIIVFHPAAERTGEDADRMCRQVCGELRIKSTAHRLPFELLRDGTRSPLRAGEDHARIVLLQQRDQIIPQGLNRSIPRGGPAAVHGDQVPHRGIKAAAGKGIHIYGAKPLIHACNSGKLDRVRVKSFTEHAVLKEDLELLIHQLLQVARAVGNITRIKNKEEPVVREVVKQCGGRVIGQRQIFV